MARLGTPHYNIGTFGDHDDPTAGSQTIDSDALNGNWLKIDANLYTLESDLSGLLARTVNGHPLTANVIVTAADLGLGNVENTALSTWAGSGNITGVGTISTGVWQGTAVTDAYIASSATWNAKQDALGYTPVPNTRTVNGHALTADVTLTKADLGLGNVENTALSTWAGSGNITGVGALVSGSIGTGFGSINIGSNTLTSGAINGNTNLAPSTSPTFTGLTLNGALAMGTNTITSGAINGNTSLAPATSPTFGGMTLNGALAMGNNTITSGLINGQTISSAASFTGTLTTAGDLTVNGTGTSSFAGKLMSGAGVNIFGAKNPLASQSILSINSFNNGDWGTSSGNMQFAATGQGEERAILFNAYKKATPTPGTPNTDLFTTGNTAYGVNGTANYYTAGAIGFTSNGGTFSFRISPILPNGAGLDTDINWGTSQFFVEPNGDITVLGNVTTNGTGTNSIHGGSVFYGNVTPSNTDTYDLGSSTMLWRKGWLSELDAIVFAKNTVTLNGGWFMTSKDAGTVAVAVTALDTTIDFGTTMTAGDIVLFRAAGQVEYVQVGTLVSGTLYNVTRNLDGSGANAWPQGIPFAVLGQVGNGYIQDYAYGTPRRSVFVKGSAYNNDVEIIREGDLNGLGVGIASETYGIFIGTAAGQYLQYTQAGGLTINGGGTFSGALSAATGTFAGSLSAATGTFAGSLTAATGDFSGTLVAGDALGFGSTFYAGRIAKNLAPYSSVNGIHGSQGGTLTTGTTTAPDGSTVTTYNWIGGDYWWSNTGAACTAPLTGTYIISFYVQVLSGTCSFSEYFLNGVETALVYTGGTNVPADGLWHRVWMTVTPSNQTLGFIIRTTSGVTFAIWGWQIEQGSSVTPYQPTDGTLSASTGYGMWSVAGGFGGTIQNPVVSLNDYGLQVLNAGHTANLVANSIMIGDITGTAASAIAVTNTGVNSTSGLFGYTSAGTTSFALKLDGSAQIGGWNFDDTHLWSGNIIIDGANGLIHSSNYTGPSANILTGDDANFITSIGSWGGTAQFSNPGMHADGTCTHALNLSPYGYGTYSITVTLNQPGSSNLMWWPVLNVSGTDHPISGNWSNTIFVGTVSISSGDLSTAILSFSLDPSVTVLGVTIICEGRGFVIRGDGTAELNQLTARLSGNFTSGTMAGFTLTGSGLSSGKTFLTDTTAGIWVGTTGIALGNTGTPAFSVTVAGLLTATGVDITGAIHATSGSFAGDGSGVTNINGGNIQTGTITATQIAAGTITGDRIAAGTITADRLSVTSLSAISANIGTVTAGSITGVTVTGGTIEGASIQTATSGQRVLINPTDQIKLYDSLGNSGTIDAVSGFLRFNATSILLNATNGVGVYGVAKFYGNIVDSNNNTIYDGTTIQLARLPISAWGAATLNAPITAVVGTNVYSRTLTVSATTVTVLTLN